jgi:hypothetical protein
MCRHPAANRRKLLILDFGSMETGKNVEAVARGGFPVMRDRCLRATISASLPVQSNEL